MDTGQTLSDHFDSLETSLKNFQNQHVIAENRRQVLIDHLEKAVLTSKLDLDNEQPRVIEVKLGAINALNSLYGSSEKNSQNLVTVQLKRKDQDTNTETNRQVVEALKDLNISLINNKKSITSAYTQSEVAKLVEEGTSNSSRKLKEQGIEISDTVTRERHDDLS